jgi:hypothetical protein
MRPSGLGLEGQVGLLQAPADSSKAVTKQRLQDLRTAKRGPQRDTHNMRL